MKKFLLTILLTLFCLSAHAVSLESAFQLGEKQNPRLDRLLPDVAKYIAFNKDGTRLIANGMGGSLVVWNIQERQKRKIGNIQAKRLFVYSSHTDQLLIQKENEVTLLALENSDETPVTKGDYESGSLSVNGVMVVLSNGNKAFGLWQLDNENSKQVNTFQTTLPVRNGLTISNDGKIVAAAEGTYRDGEGHTAIIEIWNTTGPDQPIRVIDTGEILGVWNLIFSQEGSMLAADTQLNAKSGIRVWDVHTGAQLLNKFGFEAYWTRALAFAPNEKPNSTEYIASGDEKGNLRIWKIPGGDPVFWVTYLTGIQALAFSPDGKYLAVALWDTTIQILEWNVNGK